MEDGELSDSDSELPQACAAPCQASDLTSSKPAFRKSDVPGLSSGSSDDDSDDDCTAAFRKKKCKVTATPDSKFINPLLQSKQRAPKASVGGVWNKPHKNYHDLDSLESTEKQGGRRKKGNVWGNVLEEQTLEREISSFGVEPADLSILSYRHVEAYQVPKPSFSRTAQTYSDKSDGEDETELTMDTKVEEEDDEREAKGQEGLFEMEKFGTDIKKELPKLSIKSRLGRFPVDSESDEDNTRSYGRSRYSKPKPEKVDFEKELQRYKLKRKREAIKPPPKNVKDRIGRRSHKFNKPPPQEGYISVTETDSKEVIVNALVTNLQEPKVGLMSNVVEVLGAKKAITMMTETAMIEASGGLMVANGSRRRTPGGVFLFLLRNDRHIRKDEVELIFKEERELYAKEKRKVLKAKRKQMMQRIALKLPQDNYFKKTNTSSAQPQTEVDPSTTVAMEDGELEDEDVLAVEPELEVELD